MIIDKKEEAIYYIKLLEDDKYSEIPEELKYKLDINPNILDYEYVKSTELYSELNNSFEVFDGFKCLYIKHKSHNTWYCQHITNMWDNRNSIEFKVISCDNDEYIIYDDNEDVYRLVKEIKE